MRQQPRLAGLEGFGSDRPPALQANPELAILRLRLKRRAWIQPYQLRHEVPGPNQFIATFACRQSERCPGMDS